MERREKRENMKRMARREKRENMKREWRGERRERGGGDPGENIKKQRERDR